MRWICAIAFVGVFGLVLPADDKKPATATDKLIEQLGDDDADVRKGATTKLIALGEDAVPALRTAAKSNADVDIRLRAAVIVATIQKKLYGAIHTMTGHKGWVMRCAVTPDGKYGVTSGDQIKVWDLKTGKCERSFGTGGWGFGLSKDGKKIICSQADRSVRIHETATGKELLKLTGHTNEVWVASLSPDGKTAITGGYDLTLRVWDAQTGKHLRNFKAVTDYPRCIAWSSDSTQVAVGHHSGQFQTGKGTLRVWDVKTGTELFAGKQTHSGAITTVTYSRGGKRIATSSFDKTVRLWDARTGKQLKSITVNDQACDGVAFLPDGKRLISTGWGTDHTLKVWDIATAKELMRYEGHTASVLCVAVTGDGKQAMSGGCDGNVKLWPLPK